MGRDCTEIAAHLRTVHFSLILACTLAAISLSGQSASKLDAVNEIGASSQNQNALDDMDEAVWNRADFMVAKPRIGFASENTGRNLYSR